MGNRSQSYSVKDHFAGRDPSVQKTYVALMSVLRRFGPMRAEAKKTSIHSSTRQLSRALRHAGTISFSISISRPTTGSLARASTRSTKCRLAGFITRSSWYLPADVDKELAAWLKEAYELSG